MQSHPLPALPSLTPPLLSSRCLQDEDHYDLETGSQGSPAQQEKPSANGAQENGASRNGRGTAQSLADTSM